MLGVGVGPGAVVGGKCSVFSQVTTISQRRRAAAVETAAAAAAAASSAAIAATVLHTWRRTSGST